MDFTVDCCAFWPTSEDPLNVHNDWVEYGSEEACDWLLGAVALVILLWVLQMGLEHYV